MDNFKPSILNSAVNDSDSSTQYKNIQGYSNLALSSPIRVSPVGTVPPKIPDSSFQRTPINNGLTQRNNIIVPPIVTDLSSPRFSSQSSVNEVNSSIPQSTIIRYPISQSPLQSFPNTSMSNQPIIRPAIIQNPETPNILGVQRSESRSIEAPNILNVQRPESKSIETPNILNIQRSENRPIIKTLDNNINQKLDELGYKVLETINIKRDNRVESKYIKTIDPRGHFVVIELNLDSNVLVQPSDLTTVESSNINSDIPKSIRNGVLSVAGNSIGGISFECKNGICISKSSPKGKTEIEENFFTIIGKPADRSILEKDDILAIPVIRMTDIISNPTLILEVTTTATMNIINLIVQFYHNEIKVTTNSSNTLSNKFNILTNNMKYSMDAMVKSLSTYEKIRSEYDLTIVPPETYKNIVNNIIIHRDKISKLVESARVLESIRNDFNILEEKMNKILVDIDSIKK